MAVNLFAMSGVIAKLNILTKGDRKSAVIILKYGKEREHSAGNPFVNAVPVRVPYYKFEKVQAALVEGARIDVQGHLQGVFKDALGTGNGFFNTELVADHISAADEDEAAATE
jgi:hypothetical protein